MFSTCSELTSCAPIPDGRMEQIMQPCLRPKLLPDWGLSGNVFYEFGTRLDNSIPKIWERKRNKKIHSQNFGNRKDIKNLIPTFGNQKWMTKVHSQKFGNGKGMKRFIPKIWEQEGHKKSNPNIWKPEVDDENPFPKFGNGMRDFHSQEWPGTGIPADPCIDNGVGVW